ncbi:MAG: phosphoadenosine phosphosulfate reductase family protein [Alphaproteobacteria bacterium]|nr:phosphoadenosine phosphosulfate reductase family protein [Alphaproteobacteria bacterium]
MSAFQDIRSISPDLSTPDLLRFLIREKFPGKTLVTASLKAPSIVILKMVAEIDPATPVMFCVRGFQFPESTEYRQRIVELLGLENVSQTRGGEVEVSPDDSDHYERMWIENRDGLGQTYEIVHLNKTLAPYSCWISAVYHMPNPPGVRHRVDVERRLIRVDPLVRWDKDDVRAFMREHGLPFHPRVVRRQSPPPPEQAPLPPSYNY